MTPQIVLAVLFVIVARWKKMNRLSSEYFRQFLFFLAVGLSATAPLMLTLVQKGFYFIPALPYFAIALSILVAPATVQLISKIEPKNIGFKIFRFAGISILSGVIAISIMKIGKTGRNEDLLHDVYLIGEIVPKQTSLSFPQELWNNWDLQCYLVRYFNIYPEPGYTNQFCIANETTSQDSLLTYTKLNIGTVQFDLYEKK